MTPAWCALCFIYDISVCLTCLGKVPCSGLPEDPLLSNDMNAHLHNTDHLIKAKWQAGSPILISGAVTKSSLGEEGDCFSLQFKSQSKNFGQLVT